jgi:predicted RNase H-like HicB family nuclease
MHEPGEDTEGKYMAELPGLPGCRAWGTTAAEALENLQSVATAFIGSYMGRGDPLPPKIEAAAKESSGPDSIGEVLVAV